jgi:hypothetical protein
MRHMILDMIFLRSMNTSYGTFVRSFSFSFRYIVVGAFHDWSCQPNLIFHFNFVRSHLSVFGLCEKGA